METTLDRFGRVVIPKKVRDGLGLAPGSVLKIDLVDGAVSLKPVVEEPALVRDRGLLVHRGKPAGDIEGTLRRTREARIRKFNPENWTE